MVGVEMSEVGCGRARMKHADDAVPDRALASASAQQTDDRQSIGQTDSLVHRLLNQCTDLH